MGTNKPAISREKMRRLSGQVQAAADYICAYCGYPSSTADHLVPRTKGGGTCLENLVSCCTRCNALASHWDFPTFEEKREWLLTRRRPEILQDARRAALGDPWAD